MSLSLDWRCPACERPSEQPLEPAGEVRLVCQHCGHAAEPVPEALEVESRVRNPVEVCIACGSQRLYTQKDFNRKLGLAIVLVGAVLSPWTYGLSLVACMGIDYGLYWFVPEITVCYGCDAIHRGFEHNPAHRAHDPLLAERFKQEAREETGLADSGQEGTVS